MAPTAARRTKSVQRNNFQGLQGNPDACNPRRDVVGPSYGSFASGQARKLIPSAGPLLPSRHCDSQAEVARQSRRSFFPARFIRHRRRFAGKLSPPNPLRSRWRLCRLTDAACPLRVLAPEQNQIRVPAKAKLLWDALPPEYSRRALARHLFPLHYSFFTRLPLRAQPHRRRGS